MRELADADRQRAARGVAGDREARRIGADFARMRRRPGGRGVAVLVRGGKSVLRRAAIIDREHQACRPVGDQPAETLMRLDAAEDVSAGMEEDDQRQRPASVPIEKFI